MLGVHYRELMSSTAFYRAKSFDEVAAAIERASMSPASSAERRRVAREVVGELDGRAGERVVDAIVRTVDGAVVALQISVIGSGQEHEARAAEVGRLLAERGATLVCGALDEVMAAARGAKEAGGITIGIVPGNRGPMPTRGSTTWSSRASDTPATSPLPRRVMP